MAGVSKRLATDETLMLLVDAVNNTETVKQAKAEIQAEGTAQINNVKSVAEENVKDINQVPKNTADIADINSNLSQLGYSENGIDNLLELMSENGTSSGVTLTNNGDGTLTFNGTATDYPQFSICETTLETGTYKMSSFNYDGANPFLWIGTSKRANDIVNGRWNTDVIFTLSETKTIYVTLVFVPNDNIQNKLVKPMIVKGNKLPNTFRKYVKSNLQLTDEIKAQNDSLAYNASKNMLSANVGTISGVTITSKDKSTALLNGTSTANVSVFTTADVIPSGSYHLKLSNKVGSMFVWDTTHVNTIIDVNNTECNLTLTEPSKLLVGFSVGSGHSFTNFEVSGQLEKGTVATDFVPYNGKSNLELTNDVVSLKNDLNELCNIEKRFTNENTTYTYTASEMHLENDHIYDIFLRGNYPTAGCGCCRVFVKNDQYVLFTIAAKYIEFSMDSTNGTLTVTNKYNGTQGTQLIVKKVV